MCTTCQVPSRFTQLIVSLPRASIGFPLSEAWIAYWRVTSAKSPLTHVAREEGLERRQILADEGAVVAQANSGRTLCAGSWRKSLANCW